MKKTLLLFLFLSLPTFVLHAQSLRINEFMASNVTAVSDPDFDRTADWIELYNAGSSSIDLTGYALTDDLAEPLKWIFPEGTSIEADDYLLIWADDANTDLHTSFKLSSEGEEIGLFDPAGTSIDTITFGRQTADVSFGRLGGDPDAWRFLSKPSPGKANVTSGFIGFSEQVTFSSPAGFYPGPLSVALSTTDPAGTIYFTVDGAAPTTASIEYTGPFSIPDTRVIRAAVFQDGFLPSPIKSHSYFIGESTTLPVVSLGIEPANLWSDETGLYVAGTNGIVKGCDPEPKNYNQDWEYPASMEFFEADQTPIINQIIGLKIFGGCSRDYDQKSLSVHARNRYGKGKLKYQFFETKDLDEFDSLVLRNSGQDWFRTMFRDGMIQSVIAAGIDIDHQAYRPAIVFVNGEYFGIHNIREKMNADFIDNNHDFDEDEIDFLEFDGALPIRGDNMHYNAMIDFVSNNDMSRAENLAYMNTQMDIDHYLDYVSAEIYIANADWPSGNNKFWRPRTSDGRWRWMIFDTDLSFGGNANGKVFSNTVQQATDPNGPVWPNPPWSTLLFRSLLDNQQFKNQFIQRISSHINITFDSTYVHHVIDSLSAQIESEIPRHKERWAESIGFNTPWPVHIERLLEFPVERPAYLREHLTDHFGLSGLTTLEITNNLPEGGHVYVADVPLRSGDFAGEYFTAIPLELRAQPREGYQFVGWSGDFTSSADSVEITLNVPTTIQAQFELTEPVSTEDIKTGYRFALGQNFPNPVSGRASIPFEIPQAGHVSIRVYDLLGRTVRSVIDSPMAAGQHQAQFDASTLAAGVYFYELRTNDQAARRKLVVRK